MTHGRAAERVTRPAGTVRETAHRDACPRCDGALRTRDVLEHLPCGRVYFATDAEERAPCPKCGDRLDERAVAQRGTVRTCADCGHTEDATAPAVVVGER